ncbi:hypothetical protein ABZ234_15455 [Nocardiopsis sp. NPDC006198]|uniref:hypothetical protein n=1 Tax=Nocardiopsis sp. NPDC006198 TaxID=3154472 RepID=UPI0033A53E13
MRDAGHDERNSGTSYEQEACSYPWCKSTARTPPVEDRAAVGNGEPWSSEQARAA